jgi:hypothetical protein
MFLKRMGTNRTAKIFYLNQFRICPWQKWRFGNTPLKFTLLVLAAWFTRRSSTGSRRVRPNGQT